MPKDRGITVQLGTLHVHTSQPPVFCLQEPSPQILGEPRNEAIAAWPLALCITIKTCFLSPPQYQWLAYCLSLEWTPVWGFFQQCFQPVWSVLWQQIVIAQLRSFLSLPCWQLPKLKTSSHGAHSQYSLPIHSPSSLDYSDLISDFIRWGSW